MQVIANQQVQADGLTQGYAYLDSSLTTLLPQQNLTPMSQTQYTPTADPGYFLPAIKLNGRSIYTLLSTKHWTLITTDKQAAKTNPHDENCEVLVVPPGSYKHPVILLRPDWHIA